ncbi:hypothetical protein E4K73_48505 [Streptomyces sp. IB201691-2A2]|nr:hypothetical protein E4K73_48505 [Streptomyces sp. IB201691-2A2]
MIADVARFIACDYAADRVPIFGGPVHNTGLRPGQAHRFCSEFFGGHGLLNGSSFRPRGHSRAEDARPVI